MTTPLPEPAAWQRLVNDPDDAPHFYWEECSKWEAENCAPKSDLRQLYTADQMHAHAAAVSAADNAALRERVALAEQASRWESDLCGQALERVCVLEDVLRAIDKKCFSHIDGRDLFAQMHPRNTLDIKRRVDARETWFEGDWLTDLWAAIKAARAALEKT